MQKEKKSGANTFLQHRNKDCKASDCRTTGEDEIGGAQHYVGEGLQEAKIHQVGEEADSHHQQWEAFKNIESCQHTCRELERGNVKQQIDSAALNYMICKVYLLCLYYLL